MKYNDSCLSIVGLALVLQVFAVLSVARAEVVVLSEPVSVAKPAKTPAMTKASTNQAAALPAKDYTKGFTQFYKLGLPDVSKAEYCTLQAYDSGSGMDSDWGMSYEIKMKGNAWMLSETPKVKGTFVRNSLTVQEVHENNALSKERQKKLMESMKSNKNARVSMSFYDEDDGRTGGTWKKADLKQDIDKLLAYLNKPLDKKNSYDRLSSGNALGSLFLSSIHFHSKGFTNEANQIVSLLFSRAKDPKKVISQAMSMMADKAYSDAYEKFSKTGDWNAYAAAMDAVLAKYGTTWPKAAAVRKLSGIVKQRAQQASVPELAGAGLTDLDKKLAKEVADYSPAKKSNRYYGSSGESLWILPKKAKPSAKKTVMPADKDKTVIDRIKDRGMESVPMLIAMLSDENLTRMGKNDMGDHSSSYSYNDFGFSGNAEMMDEMVKRIYDSMQRPMTMSEISASLLKPLIIKEGGQDDGSRDEEDGDKIAEEAKVWFAGIKSKAPAVIAMEYLKNGEYQHQNAALSYIMANGSTQDLQAVEAHLLQPPSANSNRRSSYGYGSSLVRAYVSERGVKAKDFLAKYEAMQKQKAPGKNSMYKNTGDQNEESLKNELESLKQLVAGTPFKEMLTKVANGTDDMQKVSSGIYKSMRNEKPDNALSIILDCASKAVDADTTVEILGLATAMGGGYGHLVEFEDDVMADGEVSVESDGGGEKKKLDISKHAEQWKKLLADTRVPASYEVYGSYTIGDIAATSIGYLYDETDPMSRYSSYARQALLGKRVIKAGRSKAADLLAGKEMPKVPENPEDDKVTKEQKKAAAAKMMGVADASIGTTVAGLSDDELVALVMAADKDEKLNAKLAGFAAVVREVSVASGLTGLKELEGIKGKPLDKAIVQKLLDACRKYTEEGRIVRCTVTRQAALDGVTLTVREILPASREYKKMADSGQFARQKKANVEGMVADKGCAASAVWPIEKVQPAPAAAAATPADKMLEAAYIEAESYILGIVEENQKAFMKSVEDFCKGKSNVCRTGMISVSGNPVVKIEAKKPETTKTGTAPAAVSK